VLFFYPKDFTFVCPTELHAFQEKLADFQSRNTEVVAVSTDTEMSHWGWLNLDKNEGLLILTTNGMESENVRSSKV